MKILYLIDEIVSRSAGGTERQIFQMAQLMREAGHEVQICALRGAGLTKEESSGVTLHFAGLKSLRSPAGWGALLRLRKWMRAQRFDVLQTFFVESNLLGPLVGRFAGVPVIIGSRRNMNDWMSPRIAFLQRISNMFATRLLANCNVVKDVMVQTEKVSPKKVDVLYNGVDLSQLTPDADERNRVRKELGVADGQLLIGNTSRLYDVKSPDVFIAAAEIIHRAFPGVRFVIVGDGLLRPLLGDSVQDKGLSSVFTFAGNQADVRRYLRAFDIAVLSSNAEGFSNSILEYVAMGLPSVVTNVGGNAEALGGGGLLVPPKDPAALASALKSLIEDPASMRNFSRAGIEHAQRFSLQTARESLHDYYTRLRAAKR